MILQVGVKAFLKNKEGRYLLLKRSRSRFKGIDGTWDIVGGRIDPGTSLVDNLKREVYEETKLSLTSEPRLVYAQDILWYEQDTHVVRLTYVAAVEGDPVLDVSENVEYAWSTVDEMRKRDDLDIYVKEILEKDIFISR